MFLVQWFLLLFFWLWSYVLFVFFFNDTATTEIYTLSLHDALPIWPVGLYDERRDLLLLFPIDHLRRRPRHHDRELRLGAVGAPQLLAVQNPDIVIEDGIRFHRGGVRAHAVLGERECRDRAFGETGKVFFLLRVV